MNVIAVTAALFCIGLFGVLTRRELIAVLASVELMLGAANVQIVAFGAGMPDGGSSAQALALLVLVLAAAEAAVGLAILVALVRGSGRSRVDEIVEVEG